MPVTRRVPGKLFITGEYAVMRPGTPAVLVAVDRFVTVTVTTAATSGVTIRSDLYPEPVRLRWDGSRLAAQTPADRADTRAQLAHALGAVEVVAELLAHRRTAPPDLSIAISSDLHQNGVKLGLGSSGAVTVAVIAAVAAFCDLDLSADARFRLAMIASARIDVGASGADLAAGTWRGWIAYRAPDRVAVLELVRQYGIEAALGRPWPGLTVHRLTPPDALSLAVGWTGSPAVTKNLVAASNINWRDSPAHHTFVAAMTESVNSTIAAFDRADPDTALAQISTAGALLARLDSAVGLGIYTDKLVALCDTANAVGWVAKPSGAGGGDCGIALCNDVDDVDETGIDRLREQWAAVGVQHLPLQVISDETDDQ